MNVNATLIIQAFHFLLVYYLLKQFIFKPLLKVMTQEEQAHGAAMNNLAHENQRYEDAVHQKKNDWQMLQHEFSTQAPELIKPAAQEISSITPKTFLPKDQLNTVIKELTKTITETVKRVD